MHRIKLQRKRKEKGEKGNEKRIEKKRKEREGKTFALMIGVKITNNQSGILFTEATPPLAGRGKKGIY